MKKIFLILFGLILCSDVFAKTKFSEVKKALKEDGYGKAIPEQFHNLNATSLYYRGISVDFNFSKRPDSIAYMCKKKTISLV